MEERKNKSYRAINVCVSSSVGFIQRLVFSSAELSIRLSLRFRLFRPFLLSTPSRYDFVYVLALILFLSLSLSLCDILYRVGTKRELLSRTRARAATRPSGNDVIINGLVSISGRLPVASFKSVHATNLWVSPLPPFPPPSRV